VQLADAASQTEVWILPSVGNIAYRMTVKGHDVLRWPHASLDAFKASPNATGIPFMGPWINRLDEQAFYANGTPLRVRHGARQRARRDPDSRLRHHHRPLAADVEQGPTGSRPGPPAGSTFFKQPRG
jgi:aldose 1-epimerase